MSAERRLTLGSGTHYAEGWVNFDLYSPGEGFREPDVRGSVFSLPFPDAVFDQVYAGHFLEHLEWDAVPDALLEVRRVCAPGAVVMVVGPCVERAVKTKQPQWLLEAIVAHWGGAPGAGHAWTPTEMLTVQALESSKLFETVKPLPVYLVDWPEWPNPSLAEWQCAVGATVPLEP